MSISLSEELQMKSTLTNHNNDENHENDNNDNNDNNIFDNLRSTEERCDVDNLASNIEISSPTVEDIAKDNANKSRKQCALYRRTCKGNKMVDIPKDILENIYSNSNVCRAWCENRCKHDNNCPYGLHNLCPHFKKGECQCGGYEVLCCPFGAHVNKDYENNYYKCYSIDKYFELLKVKNKR